MTTSAAMLACQLCMDINIVVIPKPIQTKSRQTGITVPKIILAGSHLGSAYSFHSLFLSKYGSLNFSFILSFFW